MDEWDDIGAIRRGKYKAFFITQGNQRCNGGSKGPTMIQESPIIFDLFEDPSESTTFTFHAIWMYDRWGHPINASDDLLATFKTRFWHYHHQIKWKNDS